MDLVLSPCWGKTPSSKTPIPRSTALTLGVAGGGEVAEGIRPRWKPSDYCFFWVLEVTSDWILSQQRLDSDLSIKHKNLSPQ